jgi:tetratricopeptide (TPR) repeat protein
LFKHHDDDARVRACSVLIERNPNDAIAYHHRGLASQAAGELDRAITDYNKAIALKPNYGLVYESRARVFAAKGDYTNAVADITRAGELTPKPVLLRKPIPKKTVKQTPPKVNVVAKARPQPKSMNPFNEMLSVTWPDWAPTGN